MLRNRAGSPAPTSAFTQKEGLLTPARNRSNAYRDYTAEDVRTLKLIRMLRMLDLPLPTIQSVLRGEQPLAEAIQAQQAVLEQQAARLAGAIGFCAELTRQAPRMEQLDVDDCLKRMQDPQEPDGFFTGWLKDYRTVAENEQKSVFTSYRSSPSTPRRTLRKRCSAMPKRREALCASQKAGCIRSLSGTASDTKRGGGRAAIAILSACEAVFRNRLKRALTARRERLLRWLWRLLPAVVRRYGVGSSLLYAAECDP